MRVYPLEGIANFRDFGGYPTADGRAVVRGRLFRAGHQGNATRADIELLDGLGIGWVVDLRRSFEFEREGRVWPRAGGARVICETAASSAAALPYNDFLRVPGVSPDDVVAHVTHAYRAIPYDPHHMQLYGAYVRQLLNSDGASLVSCTHGKDRTGIICALMLRVLGVDDELIMQDYLLTNSALGAAMSLEAAQRAFAEIYDIHPSLEVMAAIIRVQPVFLETAFAEMTTRSGSVEGYLQSLGIDAAARERLRAHYLT
jgi:protein tyrosine/serine phosphatase